MSVGQIAVLVSTVLEIEEKKFWKLYQQMVETVEEGQEKGCKRRMSKYYDPDLTSIVKLQICRRQDRLVAASGRVNNFPVQQVSR